jgi:hypothetical protein
MIEGGMHMRHLARTFVLVGVLAMAATAFAAAPQTSSSAAKKTTPASHSVKGTVKSIDSSSLVISRKKGGDMTFALDSTTKKEGSPAVGSDVSVQYHTEGKTMMATAITAQPAKQVAASSKPAAPAKPAASKKTN